MRNPVVWTQLQRRLIRDDRLLRLSRLQKRAAQVDLRLHRRGPDPQSRLVMGYGLGGPAGFSEGESQVVMRLGKVRPQADRLPILVDRLPHPPHSEDGRAPADVGV